MELGIFAKTFPEIGEAESLEAVRQAGFTTTQFNLACVGMPSMPDNGFTGPLVAHGLAADEAPAVAAFLRGVLGEQGQLGHDND